MTTHNITIHQGKTFSRIVRWEVLPFIYKAIQTITRAGPVGIIASAHGLVNGWRAAVVSAQGMVEINATNKPLRATDFHKVTLVNVNEVQFNDVNSSEFTEYETGGYLQYYTPQPLTGYTARMTIKDRPGGTVLKALVSPTNIVVDDVTKTITVTISAVDTAAFAVGNYVYDLEMVNGAVVTLLLSGEVEVVAEVTT